MVLIILKRTNMLQSYCLVSRSHHTVAMRRRADKYHRSWHHKSNGPLVYK